jgi:hypothetical protein
MPKIREILRMKLLVALGILLAFTTIQTARAGIVEDWLTHWIYNLLQPIIFTTLAVPVFGDNLSDAFSLIGIQNSTNYAYLDNFLIYLGSSTKDFYYNTLASIGIGLAGLAIIIGVVSLLFEGLGFLREGESYTVIKWALISPILIYIFPNVWNALAILTAVINYQILNPATVLTLFDSIAIQALLSALIIAAPTGIGLILIAAAFGAMMIFYLITMIIFGSVRIVMLTAFILLTPIFIPLMKTPRLGGIFQKFTTYAIEMLVATIVAAMLMRTVVILFSTPISGNTTLLRVGLLFALIFTPFVSLFVTNWVLGTAAGVVAMAGEHALEQSSALLGGLAGARLGGGAGGIATSLGGAAGGGAIGAVAGGGKASRIIADVPAGSIFSKAGASILANKAMLPAGAGLAGAIAVGFGKLVEHGNLYGVPIIRELAEKRGIIGRVMESAKNRAVAVGEDPKKINKNAMFYSSEFLDELNSLSDASKMQMYEIIGAQALGWDYGTLDEKRKEAARGLGAEIVEMNRKIRGKYGSAYLQKLHEKTIYPKGADKDPLKAEWLRNAPAEYIGLYKLDKIANAYLNERNPERREELMAEFKRVFKESNAGAFINAKSVEEYNKKSGEKLTWSGGSPDKPDESGESLEKLNKDDIKTASALLRNDPNLAQYRVFKSRMDTALNIAERRRHLTGGSEEWLRKAERNYLNEQMHPTELKLFEAVKQNELRKYEKYFDTDEGKYKKIMNHPEEERDMSALDFAEAFSLAGTLGSIPKNKDMRSIDEIYNEYYKVLSDKLDTFSNRIARNEKVEINDDAERAIAEHLVKVELAEPTKYTEVTNEKGEKKNVLSEIKIAPEERDLAVEEVKSIKEALKHDLDIARTEEKARIYRYVKETGDFSSMFGARIK